MTSRRSFLGLLAAAPVAAPAMIKSAAAQQYCSFGGIVFPSLNDLVADGGFTLSPQQSAEFLKVFDQPMVRLGPVEILMHHTAPWDVPNRLLGVSINDDGDAV